MEVLTMTKGPKDLPQNELPKFKDKKPSFFNNEAENVGAENQDGLSNFLNQILETKQLNKVADTIDNLEIEEKVEKMDCKSKKGVLLYISKRILSDKDKLKLINRHHVLKGKLDKSNIDELENVIKQLDKEETNELLIYLIKHGKLNEIDNSTKVSKILADEE